MGLVFLIYLRSRSVLPGKAWKQARSEILTWHNRNWGHSPKGSASPTGTGSPWASHGMAPCQRWGSKAEAATPQGTEQVIKLHKALSNSSEQSSLNNIFKLSDDCVESLQVYHTVPVLIISLWHKADMQNNALRFGKHSIFLQPYNHLSHWSSSSQTPETFMFKFKLGGEEAAEKLPFLRPYWHTFHKVMHNVHKYIYLQSFQLIIKQNPRTGKMKIKAYIQWVFTQIRPNEFQ